MSRLSILAVLLFAYPAAAASGSVSGKVTASGGEGRFIVYVEKGPGDGKAGAAPRREMVQKDSEFQPAALWVRTGDVVDFLNRDNIYHNVFSPSEANSFDLGLYRGGLKKSVQMNRPGEVDVYCNIHPNMKAKVLVVPPGSRVVEVVEGTYTLGDLEPGSYTLAAWSATHEPERAQVEVKPGQAARADFALQPRATLRHLNKNGEQYGRYK
jgi:plastocyanin